MARTKQSVRKANLAKKTMKVPKKVKPAITGGIQGIFEHFKWKRENRFLWTAFNALRMKSRQRRSILKVLGILENNVLIIRNSIDLLRSLLKVKSVEFPL